MCSCFIEFIKRVEKKDKMRGLPSILSHFRKELNQFNNTRARILDSVYHMAFCLSYDINITFKSHFCSKNVITLSLCTQRCSGKQIYKSQ